MDNIFKLLLGVLGVSALIAFLVPSDGPITNVGIAPPPSAALAPLNTEIVADDAGTEFDDDQNLDDDKPIEQEFRIGEPSIDGLPYGGVYEAPLNRPNNAPERRDYTLQPEPLPVINNSNVVLPPPAGAPVTLPLNL